MRANDLDLTSGSLQFPFRNMQEISSIPATGPGTGPSTGPNTSQDTGAELGVKPVEPIAQARPTGQGWTAAVIVSCVAHAAVAAVFLITPAGTFDLSDSNQIEGADQAGADVVGSASDSQSPGAMNVTLVPDPQLAKPVENRPPIDAHRPTKEATTQAPMPLSEPVKQPTAAPDILAAGAPRRDDQSIVPRSETPASSAVQTESSKAPPAVVRQPPIPTARPSTTAGLGGTTTSNDARGLANGQETKAAIASKGRKQADAGEAAASRYSGEVASKLARANRRVSKSAQTKARNNAMVAFVVLANGSVTDLQLAKSSGSPELDQFALNLVRGSKPRSARIERRRNPIPKGNHQCTSP
ncbi:TonB family protein [Mesorhizobium sp.]|uniref:energy transducer TonB n=1 Tax=Mesorhizobium sp. TaxID=1871066 RepID=UPI00257FA7D9|nr:TonB family protein [Mesorhizobium sp.]